MHWNNYSDFFLAATGNMPFPYQERFALASTLPRLMNVPTGAGKTATMVLGWIWRRFYHPDESIRNDTPRRLIYSLPMRVLVEQTRTSAGIMLNNLAKHDQRLKDVRVVVLMGGESDTDWMLFPEENQIIIGTQDMLLSAALNRGYAMSRFRWPFAYGLLNSDCQWCFDEVQLMGSGLTTSIQLDAFRKLLGSFGSVHSVWMSATMDLQWFRTPDAELIGEVFELSVKDLEAEMLAKRMYAEKVIAEIPLSVSALKEKYPKSVAEIALNEHIPGKTTLVIVNQVSRAQEIYAEIRKKVEGLEILLLHSRFRPAERVELNNRLNADVEPPGRIIISTQVVEAGVDISSAVLLTELAPWPSMVQRFGRCNRYGEEEQAKIYWWDLQDSDALPYTPEEMDVSRKVLSGLNGQTVSPYSLPQVESRMTADHILRKKDIVELFDTSPDLSGNDVDVSRFIRDGEDMDVSVYWRSWEEDEPPAEMAAPRREELCSVQVWSLKQFLKDKNGWTWDHLREANWRRVRDRDVRPGMLLMLNANQGGYSPEVGWTGNDKDIPEAIPSSQGMQDNTSSDPSTYIGVWQTLAEHTDNVVAEMNAILDAIEICPDLREALKQAARWHDAGKAHQVFQETMYSGEKPPRYEVWAKCPDNRRHKQRHFRHELASALSFLQAQVGPDLVAYLVAAHHGKVRLSIRSLPGEKLPSDLPPDTKIARGIWDGSRVNAADLGGGVSVPELHMDLSLMEMGANSWLERTLSLREQYGPFRLAYLEALLRTADARASIRERREVN